MKNYMIIMSPLLLLLPADKRTFPSLGVTASLRETVVLGWRGDNSLDRGLSARLELFCLRLVARRPRALRLSSLVTDTGKSLGMFCRLGSCSDTRPVEVLVMVRQ